MGTSVHGTMVVIRVSDVKDGKQIANDLRTYILKHTVQCSFEHEGLVPWAAESEDGQPCWTLFDIFDDVGPGELLSRKVSAWSLARYTSSP